MIHLSENSTQPVDDQINLFYNPSNANKCIFIENTKI